MTFLICGLGSIGKRHLKILNELGKNDFIALRSGKKVTQSTGINFNEIFHTDEISDFKIDGALITNPTSFHIETAIEISKFGIPMFIEKPLDKNLDRMSELEIFVKDKNIPVLIGYNLIYHPGIELMKSLINEGKIGKIISAKSQFGTYMPDWHKEENYKDSYASRKSLGGGVILTSIHEQNYLTDIFGELTEIKAMEVGGDIIGIEAEEGVEILMRHISGVVSNVHLNFFQKPYYRNCQIIGTEGTILWDFMIPELRILFKRNTEIIKLGSDPMELLNVSYREQMKHFIDIIENNVKPRMGLERGINDLKSAQKILAEIGRNYN